MPGIFISYRRQDAAGHAGRLFDRLTSQFGSEQVFMDVAGIEPGADFADAIEQAIASCAVLIAVIGPRWLDSVGPNGGRRLDDPADFVRIEIAAALRRGVRVIPLLVAGAAVPPREALPSDVAPLIHRQTVELRDARWDADTSALIDALTDVGVTEVPTASATARNLRRRWFLAAACVVVAGAIALPTARWVRRPTRTATGGPPTVSVAPARVLDYWLTVQSPSSTGRVRAPVRAESTRTFSAGDRVRLLLSSPQSGHLYVVNESPPNGRGTSAFNMLFPSPTSNNGLSKVEARQELRIPDRGDGFELDAEQGTERIWLVWSVRPIDELERLARWANERDRGEVKSARDVTELQRVLAQHAATPSEITVDAEARQTRIRGRGEVVTRVVSLEHR